MILEVFRGRVHYGPAMGTARYVRRLARQLQRQHDCRIVLTPEDGIDASQVAVLAAIAEEGEREMRELLEPAL